MRPFGLLFAACLSAVLVYEGASGRFPANVVAAGTAAGYAGHMSSYQGTRLENLQQYQIASELLEKEEGKFQEIKKRNDQQTQALLDDFIRSTFDKKFRDLWDRDHKETLARDWVMEKLELPESERKAVEEEENKTRAEFNNRVKFFRASFDDPKSAVAVLCSSVVDKLPSTKDRHEQWAFVSKLRHVRDEARAALTRD